MKKYTRVLFAGISLALSSLTHAAIISDYNKATALTDGWSVVYQGGYGTSFNYAEVLNSIAAGSRVALASSSSDGASTFDLFAGTSLSVLQTITALNTTIFADDAYWYRNSSSVGFSANAAIYQYSADVGGVSDFGYEHLGAGDERLSWHGGESLAYGGWRSGINTWLNGNNVWQRYVLVQTAVAEVPEPSSLALVGLGLFGLGFIRTRKNKA